MKPKLDIVSMLLVSIDGRSLVPAVKKRKAKEVFTSVRLVKNALMLKSAYQFSKECIDAKVSLSVFEGRGHSKMLAMKGESIHLSMGYAVNSVASFPLLFSRLLSSLSCLLQLRRWYDALLPSRQARHFNFSFCFIRFCTFAVRAWICWAITIGSGGGADVKSIKR